LLKGKITIVPTPIGNLKDLSIRQYEALLDADVIACEDTRVTGNLLMLIKQRKLKEEMSEKFNLDLKELTSDNKDNEDLDDTDLDLIPTKEGGNLFTKQDRMDEKLSEIRVKAKKLLLKNNVLNFYTEDSRQQDGFYGLEDEFISYLKLRIAYNKKRKGRGILLSYHKFNEQVRSEKLIKIMLYGLKVALVTDAGTPTICDPGYILIDKCHKNKIPVDSVLGGSAATLALTLSGFPADRFLFEGYLSKNQADKIEKLERIKQSHITCVIFESLPRLMKSLLSIEKIFGESQQIFIGIELTKLYQKYWLMSVREMYEMLNDEKKTKQSFLKGEITIVIPPFSSTYNKSVIEGSEGLSLSSEKGPEQYRVNPRTLLAVL